MPASSLGRLRQRGAEFGCSADHRIKVERGVHLLGQRLKLGLGTFAFGRRAQRLHQAIGGYWLDQIVRRTSAHRLDRQQGRGTGGEHQDRKGRAAGLKLLDQGAGIVTWHPLVEDNGGKLHAVARPQHGNRGFGITGHKRAPAFPRGERRNQPALRRLIVNQHDQPVFAIRHDPQKMPHFCALGVLREMGKDPIKAVSLLLWS